MKIKTTDSGILRTKRTKSPLDNLPSKNVVRGQKDAHTEHVKSYKRLIASAASKAATNEALARELSKSLGVSDDSLKKLRERVGKQAADFGKKRPIPKVTPYGGHNPTRFVPYDATWSQLTCAIIAGPCAVYGPDASTGLIGGKVAAGTALFVPGFPNEISSVAIDIPSSATGTLQFGGTFRAWGNWFFGSIFSWVECFSGVRGYVEEFDPAGNFLNAYDQPATVIHHEGSLLHFDNGRLDGLSLSFSGAIPTRAGNIYRLWVDAVQWVTAEGIASGAGVDFTIFVDSISFAIV